MELMQQPNRIRGTMCRLCIYRCENGECSVQTDCDCPILAHTKEIFAIAVATGSGSEKASAYRLFEAVCDDCARKDKRGHCRLRDRVECALRGYFGLNLETDRNELEDSGG